MQRLARHIAAIAVLLAAPASANDTQTPPDLQIPAGFRACRAGVRLADQDINGVSVRKGPSVSAPRITMLPSLRTGPQGTGVIAEGAEAKLVGTDGHGWFLIESAEYQPDEDSPADRKWVYGSTGHVYAGRGWVHGSRLQTDIVTTHGLRATPKPDAAIVAPIDRPGTGPEIPAIPVDCDGPALRLRTTLGGKTIEGWITPNGQTERLCANQRTTCV